MSKSTISTFELFQMFPDAEAARVYMEGKRWPDGAVCPACDEAKRITTRKGGYYRCNACKTDFTVRTATIFERSHIPLHKWLYAMYLLVTARKGISSLQLAKQIGVTQKSAWFMLQRLREACGNDQADGAGLGRDAGPLTPAVPPHRPVVAPLRYASRRKGAAEVHVDLTGQKPRNRLVSPGFRVADDLAGILGRVVHRSPQLGREHGAVPAPQAAKFDAGLDELCAGHLHLVSIAVEGPISAIGRASGLEPDLARAHEQPVADRE